ncbi:MAG TPA: hypothetical protein VIX89_08935 [Bryobacteraceae bacterium]
MPVKRSVNDSAKPPAGLKELVAKYQSTAANAAKSEEARQRLVRDMTDIALKTEGARIRIVEHDLANPKAKPKIIELELTDPRAAVLRLERFCNIRFALPFWLCADVCRIFIPFRRPPIIWFGFFLIFCDLNICARKITCFYIGI